MSTLVVGSNEDMVVDKFAEIYVMLRDHADDDGVPVFNKEDWKNIVDTYDKKKVIDVLAHYIINNKPIFPLRKIEYKNMKKSYSYPKIEKFYNTFLNDDFVNMVLNSDTGTNHKEIIFKSFKNSFHDSNLSFIVIN